MKIQNLIKLTMGTCNCKQGSKSKQKKNYSLRIRPAGNRISTQILAEFKKGITINQPFPDLMTGPHTEVQTFRSPHDMDCITAEILSHSKTQEETAEIKKALFDHFLFRGLCEEIIKDLIDHMRCYQLNKRETVFKQGDTGYNFFIVSSGLVDVFVDGVKVKKLGRGQAFGEIALLHNTLRKATVVALTRVRLWGLGRDSFKKIVTIGNERYYQENKDFLQSIPVFSQLPPKSMEHLLTSISVQTFNTGERIVKDTEDKPEFYIIKQGKVNIYNKHENLAYLEKGDYFGEQALIYNSTRRASAKALCLTVLLMVTKDALIQILGGNLEQFLYCNTIKIAFNNDPLFSKFSIRQTNLILEQISVKEISGNKTRYPTEELWVVIKGKVQEEGKVYELYQCMDSSALLATQVYSVNVETEKATVGVLTRKSLESLFHVSIPVLLDFNQIYSSLKSIFVFSLISETKLEKLSSIVKCVQVKAESVVFEQGDSGTEFFIIKTGSVKILSNGIELRTLGKNQYFGDRSILFDEPRSATAKTVTDCELWVISQHIFEQVIDPSLKYYLKTKCKLLTHKFPIGKLSFVRYIGKGTYSRVLLVKNEELEMTYVLKVISKETVEKFNLMRRLIEEKNTHSLLNFQFLPALVNTYKNDKYICFLCEYFPGPSLLKLIQDFGGIQLKQVQFYSAVILLTLQYLHKNNTIHRAITPENIIVDNLGYPILVELHLSKVITDRTYTIVGIPHYMSPEMIKGKGYTFFSDYWSLGVLIYEMLFTIVPFGSDFDDPYEIYQDILEKELKYPVYTKRKMKVNGLIDLLLDKNSANRGGIETIMNHSWFDGTPWDSLLSRKIVPDFIHSVVDLPQEAQESFVDVFEEGTALWAENF